jgi:thiol-disulfide isomerase/thioredoxin
MDPPIVLEIDNTSVLLAWQPFPEGLAYELQMQAGEEEWRSLSASITGSSIRKKNLVPGIGYRFRIRPQLASGWDLFSQSTDEVRVLSPDAKVTDAPVMTTKDGASVTIEWPVVEGCEGYSLRYRSEHQLGWSHIDSVLRSNRAKKKGLHAGESYYFSVRPVGLGDDWQFSKSSPPLSIAQLSQFLSNLFPSQLLSKGAAAVPTRDALAGKVIGVYFSAHWCGPCRNFTPKLAALYNECKVSGRPFEVVFCSGDNSEDEFKSYFASMPWLAINYNDDAREGFMGKFKVSGIPKLSIMAPSGQILVDNAAATNISVGMVDQWVGQCAGQV